jgi:hypothetical protein
VYLSEGEGAKGSAMTDAEASAYLTRYPDVAAVKGWNNIAGAKAHWAERGEKEGRDKSVDS